MIKEKEQICLSAVSQILREHYGDGFFDWRAEGVRSLPGEIRRRVEGLLR